MSSIHVYICHIPRHKPHSSTRKQTSSNQKAKPWHPSDENGPKETSLYLLIQLDHVPELEPPSMGANQQQQQTREMLYHRQFHCLAATERLERTSFSTEVTKST
jgi:hypothetical protein